MDYQENKQILTTNSAMKLDSVLIPCRPELRRITTQTLTFLIPKNPSHPKTVYFTNDPKINDNHPISMKHKTITIKDKMFMITYKAYKNLPLCLSEPMKFNKVVRSKLFDNTNIIWKLFKKDKMMEFLPKLNCYQRFNHFPIAWELCRKDNLYKNFNQMQKKFPLDYTHMPESYILPKDSEEFNLIAENYEMTSDNMWLIKPVASSRGRGIKLMTSVNSLPSQGLITRYISNPHLINNKKYDLRLYLLVTGYTPIKIYLFDEGLTRFASEDYNLSKDYMNNKFIHLTNYSINKASVHYQKNEEFDEEEGNKWSLFTLKNHFAKEGINFSKIWDKIKDIMIKTILSVSDRAIPLIKSFPNISSTTLFELYGVDILLDSNLNPWLMEVNLNPSLNCDSELDLKIKSKLLTDIFNIIGVIPFSHDETYTLLEEDKSFKNVLEETLAEFDRPTGGFERIFPTKDTILKYSKFIENPGEENLMIWTKFKD